MKDVYIKMGQPLSSRENWGDFYYAYALKKSLLQLGYQVRVLFREDLERVVDREIVLLGLDMNEYRPAETCSSIAWLISHPEQNTKEVLGRYTQAFVSSAPLSREWGFPYLGQAFDEDVHYPPLDPACPRPLDIVFVGNGRAGDRTELIVALEKEIEGFHLWGHYHSPHYRNVHGPLPWIDTGHVFRRAKVVVGHNTQAAREAGVVNDRLFAAIACGAFVLSDAVRGIDEIFPELAIYRSSGEVVELSRRYLAAPELREEIARACFRRNINEHFGSRVRYLDQALNGLSSCTRM